MNHKNRYQKQKFISHDKKRVFITTTVSEVIEKNTECQNGSFKTVFKCPFPNFPEPKTVVLWSRSTLEVGDKIDLTGIFKDNIFIAYSAMVYKWHTNNSAPSHCEQSEESQNGNENNGRI